MIERLNRILYFVCAVCLVITTALLLVSIWAEIDNVIIWKAIGSGFVLLLAAGIMLAINFHIIKIQVAMETQTTKKTESSV